MIRNIIISIIIGISVIVLAADLPGDKYTKLLGFQLNKTHLREIQSKLGNAPVITSGDGIYGSTSINYYYKDDDCTVSFNSDGLGGGIIVTDFILTTGKPKEKYYTKKNLILTEKDFGGLRLGMTVDDVKKILGSKVKIEKNTYSLTYIGKKSVTEDDIKHYKNKGITIVENPHYNFQISIYCEFAKGKVYKIIVFKTVQL